METWKKVFGHPNYEVTESGKMRRTKNGKELKGYVNDRGYKTASVWVKEEKKSKIKRVGKLIWETFNDCKCKDTIDHIDRNKLNDKLSNLRCVSLAENNNNRDIYNNTNKYSLDDNKRREIITNIRNGKWTTTTVFKLFGIPTNYMGSVKKRGSWDYLLDEQE